MEIFILCICLTTFQVYAMDPNTSQNKDSILSEHQAMSAKIASLSANLTALWKHLHEEGGHHGSANKKSDNEATVNIRLNLGKDQSSVVNEEERTGPVHAHCSMVPSTHMPSTVKQIHNVRGNVNMVQKDKNSPLEIDIQLSGFNITGVAKGTMRAHGFHLHTYGDMGRGCESLGPHWNPEKVPHGAPNAAIRHHADLGNIYSNDHGVVNMKITDRLATMFGVNTIIGRSITIHEGEDDMGLGGIPASVRGGNAGPKVACCVIGLAKTPDPN